MPGLRAASCGSWELSFIDRIQPVKALPQTLLNVSLNASHLSLLPQVAQELRHSVAHTSLDLTLF